MADQVPAHDERLRILWAQYLLARGEESDDNFMACQSCDGEYSDESCPVCGGASILTPPTLVPDEFEIAAMKLEAFAR